MLLLSSLGIQCELLLQAKDYLEGFSSQLRTVLKHIHESLDTIHIKNKQTKNLPPYSKS